MKKQRKRRPLPELLPKRRPRLPKGIRRPKDANRKTEEFLDKIAQGMKEPKAIKS